MSIWTPQEEPDNRTSANVFLVLLFISLVLSVVFFALSSAGVPLDNFWVNIAATVFRYMLLLGLFFLFVRLSGLAQGKWKNELLMNKKPAPLGTLISLVMAVVCIAGFVLITTVVLQFFESWGFVPTGEMVINTWWEYAACVAVLAVLPAIVEELIFRGLILRGFKSYGTVRAVLLSAFLFALFHLNPAQTVYQFVLGAVLACAVLVSGNLFYGMILHFANNFAIITYTFITGDEAFVIEPGFGMVMAVIFSAVAASAALYGLIRAIKNDFTFTKAKEKFFSANNMLLFVGAALAVILWISVFVAG